MDKIEEQAAAFTAEEERYMKRCLSLARKGLGHVAPNPMVGAVLVREGRIVGEGYHRVYGGPHAEVNAIASVSDPSILAECTLYVSLEPCAHHGKTPPCSDLIVRSRIPRVVVACQDSYAEVSGKGIARMRAAGIDVRVGLLEAHARELNKRFFTFHEKRRPYVILKWAQTLDGFIDARRDKDTPIQPLWITNELSRGLVHKWRAEEPAIMVGTGTVEKDNPQLGVRDWHGASPLRVVLDRQGRLDRGARVFDGSLPTVVFTTRADLADGPGLEHVRLESFEGVLPRVLAWLHAHDRQSLIVEGGSQLLASFIAAGLWDEARVFVGNNFFGQGVPAPRLDSVPALEADLGGSNLYIHRNPPVHDLPESLFQV